MRFLLIREFDDGIGTFGHILAGDMEICKTVERPWKISPDGRAGLPFFSCIPEGEYGLEPYTSNVFTDIHGKPLQTYFLENATLGVFSHKDQRERDSDRYGISIHGANRPRNLKGCIGPGETRIKDGQSWMVTNSKAALDELLYFMRQDEINTIEIRYA